MAVEEDLPNWVVGVVEGHLQYQVVVVVEAVGGHFQYQVVVVVVVVEAV